jgi:hypothetical protein
MPFYYLREFGGLKEGLRTKTYRCDFASQSDDVHSRQHSQSAMRSIVGRAPECLVYPRRQRHLFAVLDPAYQG